MVVYFCIIHNSQAVGSSTIYNPSALEAKAEGLLQIQGQPRLSSESEANLGYIVKSVLTELSVRIIASQWCRAIVDRI